jgi:hypothetical protein
MESLTMTHGAQLITFWNIPREAKRKELTETVLVVGGF